MFYPISDGSYKTAALTDQTSFYAAPPTGVSLITTPQAAIAFEPSPLNRVVEQGSPGNTWQLSTSGIPGSGHTIKTTYGTNVANDVILWSVNIGGTGAAGNTYYAANQLNSTTTTDENGNNTIIYKDNLGQVVCKRVQSGTATYITTYYVYDDLNNLRYVIPPLPSASGNNPGVPMPTTFTEADTVFLNFFYAYHYDARSRLIEKKIPGKGWEYTVYNSLDQPILTQDANQLAKGIWICNKYDALGRIVMMGEYVSSASRPTLQANYTAADSPLWETFSNSTSNFGYSHVSYPDITIGTGNKVLAVDYFDSYDIINNTSVNPSTVVFTPPDATVDSLDQLPRGLPVAEFVNVLGTTNYLFSVIHYDEFGRPVKTIAQNYQGGSLAYNKYDTEENQYSFQSIPTKNVRKHYLPTSSSPQLTINNAITYDNSDRQLLAIQQYITPTVTGPVVNLSLMNYNELGQLITKHLHNAASGLPSVSGFLQHIDYRYNSRGWLTRINDPTNTTYTDENYTSQLDVFAESMDYDQLANGLGGTPQYNGNISTVKWHTKLPSVITLPQEYKGFTYTYDPLNRLIQANSVAQTTGNGQYNELISYDELGNIVNLTRNNGIGNTLNNLTYNYTNNGVRSNNLIAVIDAGTEGVTSNYTYDTNGNLISDSHKTVSNITYNELNLPSSVAVTKNNETITYNYDASGEKLERIIKVGSTVTEDRTYDAGIEYVGNNIEQVNTPEGRAIASSGVYIFQYQVTDHLGNVRALFGDLNNDGTLEPNEILQTNDYYAFGRDIVYSQNLVPGPDNKYKYNGQEFQADLSEYDYGARHYDPVIGRWNGIDIMAENHWDVTPYNYTLNNPVNFADAMGMDTVAAASKTPIKAGDSIDLGNGVISNSAISDEFVVKGSRSGGDSDDSTDPAPSTPPTPAPTPTPPPAPDLKPGKDTKKDFDFSKNESKLEEIPKQIYQLGGTGHGNYSEYLKGISKGMDCSCYVSIGMGEKTRTWTTDMPLPASWHYKPINIGNTKAEIYKNSKNGDLYVWYKKVGKKVIIHHTGFYFNKGLMNSGSSTGPTNKPNVKALKYYYFNDKHTEIPIPTVYRHE